MHDGNERSPSEEEQPAESALDQAGQALFHMGRLFSRHSMKDLLQKHTGQVVELSRILVTEAVATGPVKPDQEVTVGVVAERLGIDPSTASRLVAETVGAGYLARLPSHTDSRRLRLELTDAGHKLVANAHQYQRKVFEYVTRDWTEAEQQEFARLLVKFVASVAELHRQLIEVDGWPMV